MAECKSVATPLDRNLKLDADSGTGACEPTQYRELIGSLIYLTITRPDLSYPVGLLSQFMQTPRFRGIPRGCVEVGQDHGGLEPRKPRSEVGRFLAARNSEWERTGESRARGGRHRRRCRGKHIIERKLQPNHQCPVQRLKLASEREQEIDTRLETRKRHREARTRCRGYSQVRVKPRRDRGGLEPKSKRGRRKTENRLRQRTEDPITPDRGSHRDTALQHRECV